MGITEILLVLVALLAGVGVFLVGVHFLSDNIEQLANAKIRDLFKKTANNRLVNIGIGAATTAIIQSSGVTTVLIVGFVNVGMMSLFQATSMIMGANIGTTITAHIASLQEFDFTEYVKLLTFVGIMVTMIWKSDKIKSIGFILAGLGMIFIGLDLMKSSMMRIEETLEMIFRIVDNPFLLLLIGIVVTALAQSSSATTSIIITMAAAGVTIGDGGNSVLYMILGTNIGSCVTAVMSSFGTNANAKRASLIHLLFNTFGSLLFFIVLLIWKDFNMVTFARWFPGAEAVQIAMFHTFFNCICTLIFFPFTGVFVKIATLLIKDKVKEEKICSLDDRMLSNPALAIDQSNLEAIKLADISMEAFLSSYNAFLNKDLSEVQEVHKKIDKANLLNKAITDYVIKISAKTVGENEKYISDLYNNLGDIMRIAEIADNFTKYTKRQIDDNLSFSTEIIDKVTIMVNKVNDLYVLTKELLINKNKDLIKEIDDVEESIDNMRKSLIDEHIERLNCGKCKPENSSIFINLVSNLERLGDHLTYIAYTVK
ncbi:MAG: Na/Pi cotransporter family protein [Clostridia bacterium]|nr:Na/Pi cotransporter family protein [Clostridia bacterium]